MGIAHSLHSQRLQLVLPKLSQYSISLFTLTIGSSNLADFDTFTSTNITEHVLPSGISVCVKFPVIALCELEVRSLDSMM
ncbi:MAG: hypothetical protein V7K89_22465 [Nostoc sp.]|uniref:hypothetical protein n=1 Tax=Nostoc sp. TaxID=1180 RepID=UPI002FFCE734